jgi:hypothetical protein
MTKISLDDRINKLKIKIERLKLDSSFNIGCTPVSLEEMNLLKSQKYFPADMLLILEQLGCMSWAHNGCAMINWWIPKSINVAVADEEPAYEIMESNFKNPSDLLFFAWDCDARCYFYDTSVLPWKVVICDGLEPSSYNHSKENKYEYRGINNWDGIVEPWEEKYFSDAISIIENWINNYH